MVAGTERNYPPAVGKLVRKIAKFPQVRRIILFGSRARGDHRERSDIDLAIDFPGGSNQEWDQIDELVQASETLLPIDLIRMQQASDELLQRVEKEGVVLFMKEDAVQSSLDRLGKALARLEEALKVPDTETLAVDGTIQRFEFTFEVFWKTLKRMLLAFKGVEAPFPKDVLRKAFVAGWLEDEEVWLGMLDDRNATSHIYREEEAKRIYEHIRQHYCPELKRTFQTLLAVSRNP